MSRIGKKPITLASGLECQVSSNNEVSIKKGSQCLKVLVHPSIEVKNKDSQIILNRKDDNYRSKAFHGLYRSLIQNAVHGLTEGWSKGLQFNGVGYKAKISGKKLEMNFGYSHPIIFDIPEGIEISLDKKSHIYIKGIDRQKVGQVAAQIRDIRPPEPYLGKGVRYIDEVIVKKAGKSGAEKK